MIRILIVFVLVFQAVFIQAQNKRTLVDGEVTTKTGNKIRGKIIDKGDRKLLRIIRFKSENAAGFEILNPDEIARVKLKDKVVFESRNIAGNNAFVKHVFAGQFDLYELRAKPFRYFISRGADDFQELVIDTITIVQGAQRENRLDLKYLTQCRNTCRDKHDGGRRLCVLTHLPLKRRHRSEVIRKQYSSV